MFWLLGVLVGTGIGVLGGLGCKRLRVRPLVQTLLAAWLALLLASVAMLALILGGQSGSGAYGGVGVSLEGLIEMAIYLLLVSGLHWVAGRSPRLAPHRPVLFGILGGLVGALPFAWARGWSPHP
jgi:hypothetical protein